MKAEEAEQLWVFLPDKGERVLVPVDHIYYMVIWLEGIIGTAQVCSLSSQCCHVDYKAAPPKSEVTLDYRIDMFIPSYFIIWCLWQPQRLTGGDSFGYPAATLKLNIRRSNVHMTYIWWNGDWHDSYSTSWYLGWNVELVSVEVSMATTLISQNPSSLPSKGVRESMIYV